MHNLYIHTEYIAPKWRAYVTPQSEGFHFSNGMTISSMWELKQALLTLGDDVITSHVNDQKNEIADWIRHVVRDEDLADKIESQQNRWGLVVALERQMMRTLNLPDYIAKNWLEEKKAGFTFSNGVQIFSLNDLKEKINEIPEETLQFHYQRHPNDLSIWLSTVIGDYYLAESLEEAVSKEQMIHIVHDHLEMLLDAVLS